MIGKNIVNNENVFTIFTMRSLNITNDRNFTLKRRNRHLQMQIRWKNL